MPNPSPSAGYMSEQESSEHSTTLTYTGSPWSLFFSDIALLFRLFPYVPLVFFPLGAPHPLDELYRSPNNILLLLLQLVLSVVQVLFIISFVPLLLLGFIIPVLYAIIYTAAFIYFNLVLTNILLNGNKPTLWSLPSLLTAEEKTKNTKDHFIFLNGIATGHTGLQANINQLSLTFKRPVHGILNSTWGPPFDLIQCLVQRDFGYATQDIRNAYALVKQALYDTQYNKVVFICHSQGAIEGGLICDWLLDEVPGDLLKKLEVYTFGCAANHFNNPGVSIVSDDPSSPRAGSSDNTYGDTTKNSDNGKAIGHIEHYANSEDFVALWGVLNFAPKTIPPLNRTAKNQTSSRTLQTSLSFGATSDPATAAATSQVAKTNTFMGRVYVRQGPGHLLNQHYLDKMFTLDENNMVMEHNAFMDTVVDSSVVSDTRMAATSKSKGTALNTNNESQNQPLHESGNISTTIGSISRLWAYRNGRSPLD